MYCFGPRLQRDHGLIDRGDERYGSSVFQLLYCVNDQSRFGLFGPPYDTIPRSTSKHSVGIYQYTGSHMSDCCSTSVPCERSSCELRRCDGSTRLGLAVIRRYCALLLAYCHCCPSGNHAHHESSIAPIDLRLSETGDCRMPYGRCTCNNWDRLNARLLAYLLFAHFWCKIPVVIRQAVTCNCLDLRLSPISSIISKEQSFSYIFVVSCVFPQSHNVLRCPAPFQFVSSYSVICCTLFVGQPVACIPFQSKD